MENYLEQLEERYEEKKDTSPNLESLEEKVKSKNPEVFREERKEIIKERGVHYHKLISIENTLEEVGPKIENYESYEDLVSFFDKTFSKMVKIETLLPFYDPIESVGEALEALESKYEKKKVAEMIDEEFYELVKKELRERIEEAKSYVDMVLEEDLLMKTEADFGGELGWLLNGSIDYMKDIVKHPMIKGKSEIRKIRKNLDKIDGKIMEETKSYLEAKKKEEGSGEDIEEKRGEREKEEEKKFPYIR